MALSLSTLKSLLLELWWRLFYFYKSDSFNLQLRNPLTLEFRYISPPIGRKNQSGTKAQGQQNVSCATKFTAALNFVQNVWVTIKKQHYILSVYHAPRTLSAMSQRTFKKPWALGVMIQFTGTDTEAQRGHVIRPSPTADAQLNRDFIPGIGSRMRTEYKAWPVVDSRTCYYHADSP